MAWNRSHVEFIAVLIADTILYFKFTDESYRSWAVQIFLMFLAFVLLLMTIAGFVSLIRDIDQEMIDKKTNFSPVKSYFYLKIAVGVLCIFFGLFLIYVSIVDSSPISDKSSWIWLILFIGFFFRMGSIFILGAYRKLKNK